jgi:serine phosphatase RsbU (regulator of sigma subunit)
LNLNQGVVYLDVSRGQFAREKGMLPVHAALMLYLGTSLIFYAAPFFTAGKPLGMGSDTPPSIDVVLRAPVLLFMFAMGILLNQRAAFVEQEQGRLKQEMAAAAQVQALLLPSREIPGIEAVYLPASEVGGDFYQILDRDDGSRVIVVGDVSGKGLKAAMLVSAVVGALRQSTASSPAAILADLNRVLAGRAGGGFVTCVCARWHNGEVAIANAGHPAPYINGEEHAGEPGLPLGLVEEAVYQETVLPAPSVLTFVSDGVVEATNAEGQLFGFDRTRVLSVKPAVSLAEAARAWGQNDDITVVTVRSLS